MGNPKQFTDEDFDRLSWHDCHIWGFEFQVGDPDKQDWTSDLVLHIDFIVDWACGIDSGGRFQVAPAELTFHGVTDPSISIQWSDSGLQTAIYPVSIARIERQLVTEQKVYLDRPYYRWHIRLNCPQGGEITFGAVGFTQTLLAEPQPTSLQHLTPTQRSMIRRSRS
jgi:hypothetical protein